MFKYAAPTSKFHTTAMSVAVTLQAILHTQCAHIFIINLHTKDQKFTAIKLKGKSFLGTAAMLLFHIK
jgi:hypothetical protein